MATDKRTDASFDLIARLEALDQKFDKADNRPDLPNGSYKAVVSDVEFGTIPGPSEDDDERDALWLSFIIQGPTEINRQHRKMLVLHTPANMTWAKKDLRTLGHTGNLSDLQQNPESVIGLDVDLRVSINKNGYTTTNLVAAYREGVRIVPVQARKSH
jgi:hypothetical protein